MGRDRIAFRDIGRPSFGRKPQPEDEPDETAEQTDGRGDEAAPGACRTWLAGVQSRRMLAVRRAAEIVAALPGEGESLHAILLGYFDLMNLVLALLERVNCPCQTLRIATLALSKRNVSEIAGLLDQKRVLKADVLTSDFQRRHDGEILTHALAELTSARGQRVASARSHCKIVTVALADGRTYTIEGSANLRTSRNQEQLALTRDAGLFAFFDGWLDEMVTNHVLTATDEEAQG